MPDTTTPSQQKTNDFFRTAFLTLLMVVLVILAFLAGLLVQREYLAKRQSPSNTQSEPTPTPTPSDNVTPTVSPTVSILPTENRKTYSNAKYGFQLSYPAAWTVSEETNTKCSQNSPGTHICQYISVKSTVNTMTFLRLEVTNAADQGVLGNYTNIDTKYTGYQRQAKQLDMEGVKVDRVLFIKDSSIKFICYVPSGFDCGKGVIPVGNLSVQMYVGNPAGDANNLVTISAADVEILDTIVQSFKKQ
jgi:hypothetical protein